MDGTKTFNVTARGNVFNKSRKSEMHTLATPAINTGSGNVHGPSESTTSFNKRPKVSDIFSSNAQSHGEAVMTGMLNRFKPEVINK